MNARLSQEESRIVLQFNILSNYLLRIVGSFAGLHVDENLLQCIQTWHGKDVELSASNLHIKGIKCAHKTQNLHYTFFKRFDGRSIRRFFIAIIISFRKGWAKLPRGSEKTFNRPLLLLADSSKVRCNSAAQIAVCASSIASQLNSQRKWHFVKSIQKREKFV